MTGQVPDTCSYKGRKFDIAGITGAGLPEPETFGMTTVPASTACWRGYVAHYAVGEGRLLLDELELSARDAGYKPVNGIMPLPNEHGVMVYRKLGLPVSFSGRLLLAADFIRERYVHMGFQSPSAYRSVIELSFAAGVLEEEADRSLEMARCREAEAQAAEGGASSVMEWIAQSFAREIPPAPPPAAPPKDE